jgi:hypothetical protein
MRTRAFVLLTALLLVPAAGASAQDTSQETSEPQVGSVDFGGQFSSVDGDEARFSRYRDLRSGALLDAFTYNRQMTDWHFRAAARHIGYRDQQYVAEFRDYDRVRVNFLWDQTPLFFSTEDRDQFGLLSASAYRQVGEGEYRLDDAVQTQLQAICPIPTSCPPALGAQRQAQLAQLITQQSLGLDIRHRRDKAVLDARVRTGLGMDLLLHFQNILKEGTQPWFASFGFSAANEIPGPVDHRTTDLGAALEWANARGSLKVGWDGSWFHNNVSTLIVDNPLRITDFTYASAYSPGDGTSQARIDLWPNSTMQTVSGVGTYKLGPRGRVYGQLGLSSWNQDDDLLPHTINTAIPAIQLPRATADVHALVTSLLAGYTARPLDRLWLNVRYKLYDFDNDTPEFPVHEYVRFDQVIEPFEFGPGAEPFSYTRQYVDADLSYNVMPFTALRVGYSMERDERTFREFETTTDNMFKVAVDTTGLRYVTLRAQYDFAKRTGEGLDEEVFDADNEGQAFPRQFDISDRDRNRFSFIATVTPHDLFSINGQIGIFRDERPDSNFGLIESDGNFYSVGVDVTPMTTVAFGVTYGRDEYMSLQRSRQANPGPQQTDPTRDWTTDLSDEVDNLYFNVDLIKAIPKTDVRWAFDWMSGVNDITYGLAPNQTIFVPPAQLRQLPRASHEIRRSTLDVMYYLGRRFGVGLGWIYDDYEVDDWAWNQETIDGLMLNPPPQAGGTQYLSVTRYLYRPYTGNTAVFRVRYFW